MFRHIRRFINYLSSHILFKIIFPYALLTLMVAVIGIYLNTRLVASTLEERFYQQLVFSATAVADSLALREQSHLSNLNTIIFTEGIDEAIFARDSEKLDALILPVVVNSKIDRVDVVDTRGMTLLEVYRPYGSDVHTTTVGGASLGNWPIIQKVRSGLVDTVGDKFVALRAEGDASMLLTAQSIRRNGEVIGAVMVGTHIQSLLQSLRQASYADVTLYDLEGNVIGTTLGENLSEVLAIGPDVPKMLSLEGISSPRRSITLDGRNYDLFLSIFWARGEPVGFYSVALQPTFINTYGNAARNQMALIFAAALLLVFGIGYSMANAITGQLQHLMRNAMAVAGGDFSKRTEIATGDEIGLLARSLDHMTQSLATYTSALQNRIDELVALYDSSTAVTARSGLNLDHVLRAVITSIKASVQGIDRVVAYLLDESGDVLVCRNGDLGEVSGFPPLSFGEVGLGALLAAPHLQVVPLANLETFSLGEAFAEEGDLEVLIAPLIAGQEPIGMLTLVPEPGYPGSELLNEDSERLLGTLVNQAAIAIKNAQLFETTQRAYEELRQLDDLKTQFINIAAHELRTPLGAMMGYASFVEKRSPEKLRGPMRFMVASTLRMRTMVDAMLAIQGLDAGTTFLRLTSVDVRGIIQRISTDFQPMAELEDHVLEVSLPEDLPPVQGDAEKIGLVLSNLVSNAIKFTPEKGRIQITARDRGYDILVSVSDNGVGIAPEDHERIFERFYQARAEHIAGHGGIGIGLTIVKHLVELHGGDIWVKSELGEGSTFFFTLPKVAVVALEPAHVSNVPSQPDREKVLP
jgi:signal transduction histidine kinase/HAMP domain-containing protein